MQEKKSGLSEFKNEGTGDKIFDICVWVIVVVAVCVTLYPFLYVASISVSDGMAVAKGEVMFLPKGWDLEAYHMVTRYQFPTATPFCTPLWERRSTSYSPAWRPIPFPGSSFS